ncbi:MAG: IPT/TIG domain-containing protein, partial [Deltaproteobacteria bacterium]|nr:IPT/TIG domain-containing protein [Deltaproteobacteria bacterium]
ATEVFAVTYQNPALLDAIVPDDLEPGLYDLLVINPDRSIGFEEDFFEVTADAPPIIENVSPGSLPSRTGLTLTITGTDFPVTNIVDANGDAPVTLECVNPSTGVAYSDQGPLYDGTPTATELQVTVDASTYGNGAVCLVRVDNKTNDTFDRFASVSVTNPSENLYAWHTAPSLEEGRRAPAVVSGRVTRTARFVYAIGGDSDRDEDTVLTPSKTIEWAKVGQLGELNDWFRPYDPDVVSNPYVTDVYLPEPRSMAGVTRIGRYVYLLGGNDGSGPVDTALRAQILDPLAAPRIDDISVDVSDSDQTGLDGGTWIYRVSALYASDDDDNPGGESLPSDPFVVRHRGEREHHRGLDHRCGRRDDLGRHRGLPPGRQAASLRGAGPVVHHRHADR